MVESTNPGKTARTGFTMTVEALRTGFKPGKIALPKVLNYSVVAPILFLFFAFLRFHF